MAQRPFGDRELELLEVLAGSLPRGKDQAATRIRDLHGLLQLSAKPKSAKAAGATPTKGEFDALVDDVHGIHQRLTAIAEALRARLL